MTWVMLRDRCDRTLLRRDPRRCPQSQENSDENIQRPRYHEEEMENHGASSYQVFPCFSLTQTRLQGFSISWTMGFASLLPVAKCDVNDAECYQLHQLYTCFKLKKSSIFSPRSPDHEMVVLTQVLASELTVPRRKCDLGDLIVRTQES